MNSKLKAFTLIESIVSLTLISVVVGACLLLVNQMGINDADVQRAKLMSDLYYQELQIGAISVEPKSVREGELVLEIQMINYNKVNNLYEVKTLISKNEKHLYSASKLIILDEN